MRFHYSFKSKIVTGLLIALASTIAQTSDASAKNLYVSPTGSGADGTNWKKAWKSLTTIDWSKVQPGDQILLDGGTSGITYSGAVTIPKSFIIIRQAPGQGRNGQVTIAGGSTPQGPIPVGVTITGSNVSLIATQRSGIKISSFGAECLRVQSNNNVFRNIEFGSVTGFPPYAQGKVGAVVFGGYNNDFLNCRFRDWSRCAVEKPVTTVPNQTTFRGCIFEGGYGFWGEWGVGIYGARPDGKNYNSQIRAVKCVFGPVFNKGVDIVQGKANFNNCLFLGANKANVSVEPAAGSNAKVVLNNCTLYEPNYSGMSSHQMLNRNLSTNGNGTVKLVDCIVYGGAVNVPPTQTINGGGNIQYHVTGNTTAVAAALVDPQYVQESTLWTPVNPQTYRPRAWTVQTYELASGSPAQGKGSPITNVQSIVPAYGPNSGLPPLGGP